MGPEDTELNRGRRFVSQPEQHCQLFSVIYPLADASLQRPGSQFTHTRKEVFLPRLARLVEDIISFAT